jgi:hypothetical protein
MKRCVFATDFSSFYLFLSPSPSPRISLSLSPSLFFSVYGKKGGMLPTKIAFN